MPTLPISVGVLTVSDRCSRGETTDTTGPALAELCRTHLNADICVQACVPDETESIVTHLRRWCDPKETQGRVDLILTTGGTGLAPRDITPEASAQVIERRHPGLLELARMRCYAITPRTYLSRGEAGACGRTLIVNLPGSMRGGTEMLEAMLDILPHAIETLRGEVQDDGRPNAESVSGKVIRHTN